MNKCFGLACLVILASLVAHLPTASVGVCGQGGPDAYGYYWIDNDSAGGPAYVWVDITGRPGAVRVRGLGDDNVVGPFPIGFDFDYYWYLVDSFYIGSNGHLSFSDDTVFSHPFSNLPEASRPNNMICPLAADLDFSRGEPECWYWSDGAETLVVSWIEVPEFYPELAVTDSTHTFQVIMTRSDSSFYYMYAEQHGHFEGRDSNYVIGIEDISGTVGLQYCRSGRPRYNTFHDSLAIRWWPEPDVGPLWPNVGIVYAMNETFGAHVTFHDSAVTLVAEIKNSGETHEEDLMVTAWAKDSTGAFVFADTMVIDLPWGASRTLWFEPPFVPPAPGEYKLDFRVHIMDMTPLDNRITSELRVVEYNGLGTEAELLYDDRQLEERVVWQGDSSGLANAFDIPFTAYKVERVRIPVEVSAASRDLYVWVMDADSAGNPRQTLAADTITVFYDPEMQWVVADFSDADIIVNKGKVFAALVAEKSDSLLLGADYVFLQATSRRGWEHVAGEFAPHRKRELYDLGIHMVVSWKEVTTVEPEMSEAGLPSSLLLCNFPNPFNSSTKINYELTTAGRVTLKVFNLTGRLVETLVDEHQDAGSYNLTWDASDISSGVYFYKLSTADYTCTKKMNLLR